MIFLSAILIPACASSSLAFRMMYSAYKLNKQGDNIQPWCTPFPIWNQSLFHCWVLTVASWPAYRFLRRQVRWSGIPISLRIFQFVVIHIIKGFSVVNKAEVDVLLELSCLGTRARKSCVLKYKDLIKLIPFTASSKIFLSKNDWVFFFPATNAQVKNTMLTVHYWYSSMQLPWFLLRGCFSLYCLYTISANVNHSENSK